MNESAPPTVRMSQDPPEVGAESPRVSERERAIAAGQVRHLYDHASYGSMATVTTALMVVAVEWGVADHTRLLWWAAYMGVLTAIRFIWLLRFRRVSAAHTNLGGWGTLFVAGAALAGLGWGSSGLLFFPETSTPHQLFLMLILCAMTAGAIPVLSGRMTAYLGFLLPGLSPAIVRFFVQGNTDATLMGLMGLVYMGAMVFGAWKMHSTILEALTFRYDNLDLATKLTWEVVERKQAEAALRVSHERFELAAEGSREGLWDVEIPDVPTEQWLRPDRPIYYSPRFKALLGFAEEEFPNVLSSWESRLHPDDRARVLDAALAHLLGQEPYEVEYRLLAKSGAYRWYVSRGQATWNEAGRPLRMAGSFSDITERKREEAARRESEERFRAAFAQTSVGIAITELAGGIREVNDALCRITGYSKSELLAAGFQSITHPDDLAENRELVARLVAGDIPNFVHEKRYLKKNGEAVWAQVNLSLARNSEGKPLQFVALVEDITERKRTEETLRRTHGVLMSVVDNLPAMLFVKDATDLTFVTFNKAAEELTGYAREELLGKSDYTFFPSEQADFLTSKDRDVLRSTRVLDISEETIDTKHKGRRLLHTRKIPILDERGQPLYLLGISEDITERKRIEDGLREGTARLLKQQSALIDLIRSQSRESQDLPALVQRVTWMVGHTLGVQRVSLWRLTDDGQRLICADLYELAGDRHSSGAELAAEAYPEYIKALGGDRIIVADDVRRDPRTSELSAGYLAPLGITSMMDVPLHVHGTLRGILCHEHVGVARSWTIDEQLFALAASNLIALAYEQVERTRAEEALRASQAQYRLLVDTATDIIYRTDAQGYLRLINPTATRLTQYAEHELLGHRFIEFIRPDARPAAERFYGRQFVRKIPSTYYEYPLIRKDGSEIWIGQNVQVLLEDGQVVGFQAVARDITERKRTEEALRASQTQYRLLVDTATDIIYRTDAQGYFTFVNPPAIRITQFEEGTLLGLRFVELIRPDARPAAERFYGRQFVRKTPSTYYEYPIIRKDGQEVWIGQNVQVLLEDGQVVGFQAVARDITERKQAEEGLKEQMRLSMLAAEVNGALVQRAPLHAMLQSCAEALVRHLDAVFARIWLLGPGDLCGDCHKASHCADRTHCLHLEASAGLYRNLNGEYRRIPLGALKIGKIAQGHGPMVTNDVLNDERLQNKDWMQQHGLRSFAGYPLLLESQVMGVMAIFARHPLTGPAVSAMETVSKALSLGIERKKAEEALQESEQRLELALRGGDLGTWDWQVQTGAAVFNRRWAEMLGYALEELAPHIGTWERLVHSEDLPQVMDALQAHLNGNTSAFESELRMKTKGGGWRWILARGRVVSRDAQGRPVRATGTHLDITDRKRAEADVKERSRQLEAANKELEAFSYSVSHDLRAPLRHIDGFAELLEQQAAPVLDEKGRKYLRAISDSAQRMGRLIDDLLEFSRTGRAELHARVVPLEALVRNVLDDLQPETEGRTIDWTIGPLPKVQGDPALLRQVWFNLVANAIKYTRPRDRATIEIGRAPSTGDHEVVVFVRDNGVGFDMQYVGKLFGVFQRLHGIDDFEGSGIGLANVQRIVARHGGRVWAEGAVGRGATFYVALPLLEGDGR